MAIWTAFNAHFAIPRYNLLPEAQGLWKKFILNFLT